MTRRVNSAVTNNAPLMSYLRLGLETWYSHSHLGRVLESQLRELRPACVYTLLGNYFLTKLTFQACQKLDLPLYIHVTDDFVTSLYRHMPCARQMMVASDSWMRQAVDYASGLAAISPIMAEEFTRRYGKPWNWFTTLISADDYDPTPRAVDGVIRLVYAGNLGLQRWQSLARLARALDSLHRSQGLACALDIYGAPYQLAQYGAALHVPGITSLKGWLHPDELPAVFHTADVLVHVESFEDHMAEYTRFSCSTKISQYLMAGRCILAVGPQHLGSTQMVERVGGGIAISARDETRFAQQLAQFLRDRPNMHQRARQGRRWALEWLDATDGRARFRQSVLQALAAGAARKAA